MHEDKTPNSQQWMTLNQLLGNISHELHGINHNLAIIAKNLEKKESENDSEKN